MLSRVRRPPLMSRSPSFVITLPEADRAELRRRARCYSAPHAEVVRAKIVLLAADGLENVQIAARLDVHVNVAGRWRRRFAEEGPAGLAGPQRTRPPPGVPPPGGGHVQAMGRPPPANPDAPPAP